MPVIVLAYDKLLLTISVNTAGQNMIAGSHLMIVAILAMLSNIISASSISRDGGNFYISKIVPVNYYTQIGAKLVFNAVFTVGAILVTMCISFIYQNALQVILGSIAVMFASIGHIAMSLDIDIKTPILNYQGNEDNSAMKKNTLKSTLYGLAIGIIMGLIVIGFAFKEMTILPYVLLVIAGLAFGIYRIYMLVLRIHLQYDKIEM
jgi:ABC-2 type transport system permease protein